MRLLFCCLVSVVLLTSCKKRPDEVKVSDVNTSQLTIKMANVVDGKELVLKTGNYINANGDSFTVDHYKYYISNIKLLTSEGKEFSEAESYHLIDQEIDSSLKFTIKNVAEGEYTKISFLIGVDSTRNVSGAQTGALDLANGMYWDWNSGYIMAKLEGQTPNSDSKYITFHTGGYSGPHNVIRKVTLDLPGKLSISKGKTSLLHMQSDVAEWFKSPLTIKFGEVSLIMSPGVSAAQIADNYQDMFTVTSVEQ